MRKLYGFTSLFVPVLFFGLVWPQDQPKFGWKKTGDGQPFFTQPSCLMFPHIS
jgi:hypothetical protein